MALDFNKTLNLPATEFPMRAGLPQREPAMLAKWYEDKIYESLMEKNGGKPLFLLHDGPPYANGDIHMGTALNKVLKDFIVRYKNMSGFKAPYIPGWDTHGLPIESQIIKKYKIDRANIPVAEFRDKCRDFALDYLDRQREQFMRLGGIGDWQNPYVTLNPAYEARQIEVFGEMFARGYIYKGLKPVYWCPHDETALAEAEIEYQDSHCKSIYVKFRVTNDNGVFAGLPAASDVHFLIWTTTTWTLPGNLAISVNPEFEYSAVRLADGSVLIIASELIGSVMETAGLTDYTVVGKYAGSTLERMVCRHPFLDRDSLVICGGHVTLDAGTGCVHTAPGHGHEDFEACRGYDIDVIVPVNSRGIMTEEAGLAAGMYYEKANDAILEDLRRTGALFAEQTIDHTYPHCWRCKHPVIYRATEQWFASVDAIKDAAIEAIRGIKWVPAWGEERLSGMVRERADWCISRQRNWGVPIPIFYCGDCGREFVSPETITSVANIFEKEGSNAWYIRPAGELMPEGSKCPHCGCGSFTKETDIMDVWFDSGSSHVSVLEANPDLKWPADMYLEGGDQFRGWFQSSLLTAIAVRGAAPYKSALAHGWVVDGEGKKMSKSLGNYIVPADVIKDYGADILRLWVSSSDYRMDMRISKEIFKQLGDIYLKIRNTARFILGNLDRFDPSSLTPTSELLPIDRWALSRLNRLVERVRQAYDEYEFHVIYHTVHNFCVSEMSNVYLDIIKDRLYCEPRDSSQRHAAQTVMYHVLDAIVRMIAPILAFTSDEIWKSMPHASDADGRCVLFNDMPSVRAEWELPDEECARWEKIMALRGDVNRVMELARAAKLIGKPLEASVILHCDKESFDFVSAQDNLAEIFIVSNVTVLCETGEGTAAENFPGVTIRIDRVGGCKCARCWMYTETVKDELCERCADVVSKMENAL